MLDATLIILKSSAPLSLDINVKKNNSFMNKRKHRIALVCMTPPTDGGELSHMKLPSYGIRRIMAAILSDDTLKNIEVALIDVGQPNADTYIDALDNFAPDLIGFSVYVWSTPCLIDVAKKIKTTQPNCIIVFGGPSARPAMFDLPCNTPAHTYLDAVVTSDGEHIFRAISHITNNDKAALRNIPGLHLPQPQGWHYTGAPRIDDPLNSIPSPFQMGLMEKNSVAYLESFRGCPLSCVFCEWGATGTPKNVFSADYLTRELEAYAELGSPAVFNVDAGLNLNAKAFRHLMEAERRVGFLKSTSFWCEVYPSHLTNEHLEFLAYVQSGYIGVGLQTLTTQALDDLQRPFNLKRFESAILQLAPITNTEIQIILGLPGDTPEGFLRTLEYARSLPVGVRAYHCLVLPDALMNRGKSEWRMDFDPVTLAMHSCQGWEPGAINNMRTYLSDQAIASGGSKGDYWWFFPAQATA